MRCLLTGELTTPASTHPKIEGLADVGGQPTGSALISFDKAAFGSYGLKQSANCAVSEETAMEYRAALNKLVAEDSYRLVDVKVVHWFKERIAVKDDPLAWLYDPVLTSEAEDAAQAQRQAAKLLDAIRSGTRVDLAGNRFYTITLSGAAGRVMVRDYMEGAFEDLAESIDRWFSDLSIVHREGGRQAPPPKFMAVLGATARDLGDVPAPLAAKLWRVALRDELIPGAVLAQTLHRVRCDVIADDVPNHARMGVLKAYHIRKARLEGDQNMGEALRPELNENHPSAAYQCGRLMAALARLQRAALGDVGAGVVQRYYAAASTTPALVLGRLTRTGQFHLNKLEGGLSYWFEDQIAAIYAKLGDDIPRTLDLEGQSLFALGYYQQLAHMRTRKQTDAPNADTEEGDTQHG